MNEQFVNESNEKPRILIVDNNSQFARSARLLLDQTLSRVGLRCRQCDFRLRRPRRLTRLKVLK